MAGNCPDRRSLRIRRYSGVLVLDRRTSPNWRSRTKLGAMSSRLEDALARIDAVNAEDTSHEVVDGTSVPKELVYGRRMSETLAKFAPDASEALKIAVRAQHVGRFRIPRGS